MTKIKYHTKEEAIQAVTRNGFELEFCAPELQNNEEVVTLALKKRNWAFEHASDELKSNKVFIMKALNEGINPVFLVEYANISIQSDLEVMTFAVEKSTDGWAFSYAKGDITFSKELAAKALVKWGRFSGNMNNRLWSKLHPTLQTLFHEDSWYEKAQSYLNQLEQEKQAELVSGGSTAEDGVVW